MNVSNFFQHPQNAAQKQYKALRAFYMDKKSAIEVGQTFGYSKATVCSIACDFKKQILSEKSSGLFFKEHHCAQKEISFRTRD